MFSARFIATSHDFSGLHFGGYRNETFKGLVYFDIYLYYLYLAWFFVLFFVKRPTWATETSSIKPPPSWFTRCWQFKVAKMPWRLSVKRGRMRDFKRAVTLLHHHQVSNCFLVASIYTQIKRLDGKLDEAGIHATFSCTCRRRLHVYAKESEDVYFSYQAWWC